jgi:uncharacterized protein
MRTLLALLLVAIALLTLLPTQAFAQPARQALVIGNQDYAALSVLENPIRDAEEVARSLQRRGFRVTLVRNANSRELRDAVDAFVASLTGTEIALFYYAGHAVSLNGRNYLAPVDASLHSPEMLDSGFIPMSDVIGLIAGSAAQFRLFFLDACRSAPYRGPPSTSASGTLVDPAIRLPTTLPANSDASAGTIIMFSAAPSTEASDGPPGDHSPFAAAFLENIHTPVEVSTLLSNINRHVIARTRDQNPQVPWVTLTMMGELYLADVPINPVQAAVVSARDVRPPSN